MDFTEKCACCGSNLDRFLQPVILSILAAGPCNGYGIVKRISEYSTFQENGPDPTGVYRYLKIMCAKGMLAQEESEDKAVYALSENGRQCLAKWLSTLDDYARQIDKLRQEIASAVAICAE